MIEPKDVNSIHSLANELAAKGLEEGNEYKLRSAVSRAYYAVFLTARQKTRTIEVDNVHSTVIGRVRRLSKLRGDSLYELKEYRQSADYDFPRKPEHANWETNWSVVSKKSSDLLEKFKNS